MTSRSQRKAVTSIAVFMVTATSAITATADSLLDKMRGGLTIKYQTTDCAVPSDHSAPTTLTYILSLQNGVIVKRGLGVPGAYEPYSTPYPTSSVSGNIISLPDVSASSNITVSADGTSCSNDFACSGGRKGRAVSCTIASSASPGATSSSSACPNDPISYVKVTSAGNNRFVVSNSCPQKSIQVNFKAADVYPDCTKTNDTRSLAPLGHETIYSYCRTPPDITSATFSATSAR